MQLRIILPFLSILISVVLAAQEPVKPSLARKIMTATRQVTLFTGLEKQVLEGIQKKDKSSLQQLLADDFEIWTPNGDPISLEDWLPAILGKYNLKSFRISQMSVRDFGDTVVVKFMRSQKAAFQGKDDSGEYFVVDVWRKAGEGWKLSDRYVSRIKAAVLPPKPTGKE